MESYVNFILEFLKQQSLTNLHIQEKQIYTLKHKYAFVQTAVYLGKPLTTSCMVHDTEKLVLYPLIGVKEGSALHRKYSRHHIPNLKDVNDFEDCVIDFESARLTKPDKPLNAYNTILKYKPDYLETLAETLKKLGLYSPNNISLNVEPLSPGLLSELIEITIRHIINIENLVSTKDIEHVIREINL